MGETRKDAGKKGPGQKDQVKKAAGQKGQRAENAFEASREFWFPDWRGQTVVVAGAGPSLEPRQLSAINGRHPLVVINRSFELAPWADLLYGCDFKFWDTHAAARTFAGLKVSQDARACLHWPDIHRVKLVNRHSMSLEPGIIGSGGNGGFQALNLVVQFGAARIVLLGFDMTVDHGVHWHGRHEPPLHNPTRSTCEAWRKAFQTAARELENLGIDVINATPGSALTSFRCEPLETALGS